MATLPSAPSALREGWDYNTPAESPAERVVRLEEIVATLQKSRTFANVQLVCMNVRFAWGGIYLADGNVEKIGPGVWDEWNPGDDALLSRFIAVTDRAVILISDTYTPDPREAAMITRYTRSCSARLSWAKLLEQVRERNSVRFAMLQYVEDVRRSLDPVD